MLCGICMEEGGGEVTKLECGHSFHCACILDWARSDCDRHAACPLCRAEPKRVFEPVEGDYQARQLCFEVWEREARGDAALRSALKRARKAVEMLQKAEGDLHESWVANGEVVCAHMNLLRDHCRAHKRVFSSRRRAHAAFQPDANLHVLTRR